MKLTTIVCMACMLLTAATCYSQQMSISVKDAPPEKVFNIIGHQTGCSVFYDHSLLKEPRNVSLHYKDVSPDTVLDAVLRQQVIALAYVKIGTTFTLIPRGNVPAGSRQQDQVSPGIKVIGKVVDEKGQPLSAASVKVKQTGETVICNDEGIFLLPAVSPDAWLIISRIDYETMVEPLRGRTSLTIRMHMRPNELDAATVSNGYQELPKERSAGAIDRVAPELFGRKVTMSPLDRLNGTVGGLNFLAPASTNIDYTQESRRLFLNIWGSPSVSDKVSSDPLIVVDGFVYEGDLRNINPNDIASVYILKDASATSIWGARAGNGVIVINMRKGRYGQKLKIDFGANITRLSRPNYLKDPTFLDASDYIDAEDTLFRHHFFDADLANTSTRPPLSPVVETLYDVQTGKISAPAGMTLIDALRSHDVRKDYMDFVYQPAFSRQCYLNFEAGSDKNATALSMSYDHGDESTRRNYSSRYTLGLFESYKVAKNLELIFRADLTWLKTVFPDQLSLASTSVGGSYSRLWPYASLQTDQGPATVTRDYRAGFVDSMRKLGVDWGYRPLEEMNLGSNETNTRTQLIHFKARYHIGHSFLLELDLGQEYQSIDTRRDQSQYSYYVRNIYNRYLQINPATGVLTPVFPKGDILTLNQFTRSNRNARLQLDFNHSWKGRHAVSAIMGGEFREFHTGGNISTIYGFNPETGTSPGNLNFGVSYPMNPIGSGPLPSLNNTVVGELYRNASWYTNGAYTFDGRYILNFSVRKDGSNIFGVRTNDRFTPLYSLGTAWYISKEPFFKLDWMPLLRIRATFGYSGNVYNGSAYFTGTYINAGLTGNQAIAGLQAPNPGLHWEKIQTGNIGIDAETANGRIVLNMNLYQKKGLDLIESLTLAPSTGFTDYTGNAASTLTHGVDLTLLGRIITGPKFKWNASLIFNSLRDKVTDYDPKLGANTLLTTGQLALVPARGKPLYGVYSFPFAGLDGATGDPRGFVNKQPSNDYAAIFANTNADSMTFNGSGRPTFWGFLRQDFYMGHWGISFNIGYKGGYVMRRSSLRTSYADMLTPYAHMDYRLRWQHPGDEKHTTVPSLTYQSNLLRSIFYQYSSVLVERADHIRLVDIRLTYTLEKARLGSLAMENLQFFCYMSGLGILWRANSHGIDPDNYSYGGSVAQPQPFSISVGFKAGIFK